MSKNAVSGANETTIICNICSRYHFSKEEYEKHLQRHAARRAKRKVCHICSRDFSDCTALKYHLAHHGEERPYLCDECPKDFKTKADLDSHKFSHNTYFPPTRASIHGTTCKNVKQKCDQCDNEFWDLKTHIETIHENIRRHVCQFCSKTFTRKHILKRHVQSIHEKRRDHKCEFCQRTFTVNKVLKRHILRVHIEKSSKRREYTCDYCGSLFTNQKELLQHLRSHLRSRPRLENRCNLCPRSFSRSISLKRHVARSHIHRRTVLCHLCGKHMLTPQVLQDHLILHEQKELRAAGKPISRKKEDPVGELNCAFCGKEHKTRKLCLTHEENCRLAIQVVLNEKSNWYKGIYSDIEVSSEDDYFDEENKGQRDFVDQSLKVCESNEIYVNEEGIFSLDPTEVEIIKIETETFEVASDFESESILSEFLTLPEEVKSDQNPTVEISPLEEFESEFGENDEESLLVEVCPERSSQQNSSKGPKLKPKYTCASCDENFTSKTTLSRHFRAFHKEKRDKTCYQCDPPKTFVCFNYMKSHIAAKHNGGVPCFACDICGKEFTFNVAMRYHIKTAHLNARGRSSVKTADKGLEVTDTTTSQRKYNKLGNIDEEREIASRTCYQCDPPKVFNQQNYLRNHNDAKHCNGKPKYVCPICQRPFFFRRSVFNHIQRIHATGKDDKNALDNLDAMIAKKSVQMEPAPEQLETYEEDQVEFPETEAFEDYITMDSASGSDDEPLSKNVAKNVPGSKVTSPEVKTRIKRKVENLTRKNGKPENSSDTKEAVEQEAQSKSSEDDSDDKLIKKKSASKSKKCGNSVKKQQKKTKSKRNYSCLACQKSFSSKKSMSDHLQLVHEGVKAFKCSFDSCSKEFKRKEEFYKHLLNVHNVTKDASLTCHHCEPPRAFSTMSYLQTHIKAIHGQEARAQWPCKLCDKVMAFKSSLERHVENIHSDVTYRKKERPSCVDCKMSFVSKERLAYHRKTVHSKKQITLTSNKCDLCKEKLKSSYLKNKHMAQVHRNGELKTRTCHVCSEEFLLYDDYKAHIDAHVDHFICVTCGNFFDDEATLAFHIESHRVFDPQYRRFECDTCGYKLASKAQIVVHLRKHFDLDPYVCDKCGKAFKFQVSFLRHKEAHDRPNNVEGISVYPCRVCKQQFDTYQHRKKHEVQHIGVLPHKCLFCEKAFALKASLTQHMKTHKEKSHICKHCNVSLTSRDMLIRHEREQHPEFRPFICTLCFRRFKSEYWLNNHKTKCPEVASHESSKTRDSQYIVYDS